MSQCILGDGVLFLSQWADGLCSAWCLGRDFTVSCSGSCLDRWVSHELERINRFCCQCFHFKVKAPLVSVIYANCPTAADPAQTQHTHPNDTWIKKRLNYNKELNLELFYLRGMLPPCVPDTDSYCAFIPTS